MNNLLLILLFVASIGYSQQEINIKAPLKKATVFFTGTQLFHELKMELKKGKQDLVFKELTDFVDPNSIQIKAKGDLTILGVKLRKSYEEQNSSKKEIELLNKQKNDLQLRNEDLQNEYVVLEIDKNLLLINQNLKGVNEGVKMSELKEAYAFMHEKLMAINKRKTDIYSELEEIQKEINAIEQKILSLRNVPIVNYSEVLVEVDVNANTSAELFLSYISPNATWAPFYDMRSDGIGKPIQLEAKALISQGTGIDWQNIDLVLSTNDPYENIQAPTIKPWYIFYNNNPQKYNKTPRKLPVVNYDGQKIRGEVIDVSTGLPMSFANIKFRSNPNIFATSDFDGKFEITVPKGEKYIIASYVGFNEQQVAINSAYIKFFMKPKEVELLEVQVIEDKKRISQKNINYDGVTQSYANGTYNLAEVQVAGVNGRKRTYKRKDLGFKNENITTNWAPTVTTISEKKDMRMEYSIASKMTIPSNNLDYKVSIANYELKANYEYHCVPKMDQSVYLSAEVSGWENLNLLSGESNLYFDGTYLGKSYLDANTTKDTLSFSFGKENKMEIDRIRIKEKSRQRVLNNRQKVEIAWEIRVKNNGASMIPLIIKDQFPISKDADIKVKEGKIEDGNIEENTRIITWRFDQGLVKTKSLFFDYSVDYKYGNRLYLE